MACKYLQKSSVYSTLSPHWQWLVTLYHFLRINFQISVSVKSSSAVQNGKIQGSKCFLNRLSTNAFVLTSIILFLYSEVINSEPFGFPWQKGCFLGVSHLRFRFAIQLLVHASVCMCACMVSVLLVLIIFVDWNLKENKTLLLF